MVLLSQSICLLELRALSCPGAPQGLLTQPSIYGFVEFIAGER